MILRATAITALLLAVSCGGKTATPDTPDVPDAPDALSVTPTEYAAAQGGDTFTLSVTSPARPVAVSDRKWVKITDGTYQNYKISYPVAVEANESSSERSATITLTGGTLSATVSVTQPGKAEPEPEDFLREITPGDNAAWQMASRLGLGWNLGNQLDAHINGVADETCWGNAKTTQQTFNSLKAKGFTSVRIPVTWMGHIGAAPDCKIEDKYMDRVAEVLGYAREAGLNAIVNIHHDGADSKYWLNIKDAASSTAKYDEITAEFRAVWKQIATRFKDEGDYLMFEAFNEIHDGGWGWGGNRSDGGAQYRVINKWAQAFVDTVRETGGGNSARYLGIPGYCADPQMTIDNLVLPKDSATDRLLVAVHCYDPSDYTLESKYGEWGHSAKNNPAPTGEKEIVEVLAALKAAYIDKGIPVYFGESGCSSRDTQRETLFQKYYFEFVYKACKNYGIAPFLWDNGAKGTGREANGFIDHATGGYIGVGETMIGAMKKAVFTESKSYTLKSVYDNAPN